MPFNNRPVGRALAEQGGKLHGKMPSCFKHHDIINDNRREHDQDNRRGREQFIFMPAGYQIPSLPKNINQKERNQIKRSVLGQKSEAEKDGRQENIIDIGFAFDQKIKRGENKT